MQGCNVNLIALLRSTLVGLEGDTSPDPVDPGVSDLKRSVVRAVADLELHKLENDRFEHAGEIASVLARAGRAAYIVHPSLAEPNVIPEADAPAKADPILD